MRRVSQPTSLLIKRLDLFKSHQTLLLHWTLRSELKSFFKLLHKNRKAQAFFLFSSSSLKNSPSKWIQKLSLWLFHRASPLQRLKWLALPRKRPPFQVRKNDFCHWRTQRVSSTLKPDLELSSQCEAHARVWFTDVTLALIGKTRVWWSSRLRFVGLSSKSFIKRGADELHVKASLNAGLTESRVWFQYLEKVLSCGVQTRTSCEPRWLRFYLHKNTEFQNLRIGCASSQCYRYSK